MTSDEAEIIELFSKFKMEMMLEIKKKEGGEQTSPLSSVRSSLIDTDAPPAYEDSLEGLCIHFWRNEPEDLKRHIEEFILHAENEVDLIDSVLWGVYLAWLNDHLPDTELFIKFVRKFGLLIFKHKINLNTYTEKIKSAGRPKESQQVGTLMEFIESGYRGGEVAKSHGLTTKAVRERLKVFGFSNLTDAKSMLSDKGIETGDAYNSYKVHMEGHPERVDNARDGKGYEVTPFDTHFYGAISESYSLYQEYKIKIGKLNLSQNVIKKGR